MHQYDGFFIRCLCLSVVLVCVPVIALLMTAKLFISMISMCLLFVATLAYMAITGLCGVAAGIIRPLFEDAKVPTSHILDYWKESEQRDFFIWCFVLGIMAGGSFVAGPVPGVMVSAIVLFTILEMADSWMTILKARHSQAVLDGKLQEIRSTLWLAGI